MAGPCLGPGRDARTGAENKRRKYALKNTTVLGHWKAADAFSFFVKAKGQSENSQSLNWIFRKRGNGRGTWLPTQRPLHPPERPQAQVTQVRIWDSRLVADVKAGEGQLEALL